MMSNRGTASFSDEFILRKAESLFKWGERIPAVQVLMDIFDGDTVVIPYVIEPREGVPRRRDAWRSIKPAKFQGSFGQERVKLLPWFAIPEGLEIRLGYGERSEILVYQERTVENESAV